MAERGSQQPGRPRAASPQLLEDAAVELFVENGYAATTIDAIAQRAGVSRNTFFNYFSAKSDVLWFDVDRAIEALRAECARDSAALGPIEAARAATLRVAQGLGNDRVPLALTQLGVIGAKEEIEHSGLVRVGALAEIYRQCIQNHRATTSGHAQAAVVSSVLAAAAAAGLASWAQAGIGRASLADFVADAFAVVFGGLDSLGVPTGLPES